MRVLHVYRTFFPDTQGGLEEVVRQICKNTVTEGVESRLFCLSHHPEPAIIDYDGIKVYRVKTHLEIASCGLSFSALSVFKELVDWADVVHYQFPWPFADVLHLLARVKKPTVLTYQSDIVRQQGFLKLYRPLKHLFLKQMDALVATSPNYARTSPVLQRYADKVEVIPIGLDEASYPIATESDIDAMRQRVGEKFFLFIGVLRYYKGLSTLLEAAKNTDLPIIIVGSGAEEQALKAQAKTLDLNHVYFMGRVSNQEKAALIALSLAIVFPSHLRSEAFGVTLLEGSMQGKPMISCELGTGTSFVNKDNETGFVVPPVNPEKFRDAMEKLRADSNLVEKFGKAARKRYEDLFTGHKMGLSYATLYSKVLLSKKN
ncbi:MAG: glycosyltransferase [Methylococcales bacterium]|nr:glycosyltransferase [Methylococcales bacterium]